MLHSQPPLPPPPPPRDNNMPYFFLSYIPRFDFYSDRVHVRRTDKVIMENGPVHKLEEYMIHVEEWFNALTIRRPDVKRKVFLATDSPDVIDEAISR